MLLFFRRLGSWISDADEFVVLKDDGSYILLDDGSYLLLD